MAGYETNIFNIIPDLWKTLGNNPRNRELADTLSNVPVPLNPFSINRGVNTLSNVDINPIKQSYLDLAYGVNNPQDNRSAANQLANIGSGVLDVAPTLPVAKAGAKGLLKVTENLPVGMSIKDVGKKLTNYEKAHLLAQERAALPVSEGGLGLPKNNTAMDRADAMNAMDFYHGTQRLDRLLEKKGIDPKRATSGPMPYGTPSTELASGYAMSKPDTSRIAADLEGNMANYFQVSPKQLGYRGTAPYSVEQSWYHLTPEQKATISENATKLGYQNPEMGEGPFVLHENSANMPFSISHYDYTLNRESRGNPLTAIRKLYGESGMIDPYDQSELADIYKTIGYPHEISQSNAPWAEAKGVLTGKAMIKNPLHTSDVENLNSIIPKLKEAFKNDRSRLKIGADNWAKDSVYTPKSWVDSLENDLQKGDVSHVWTSIPDKVTEQLKKLGYDSIIDASGKNGGYVQPVIIPFNPSQVRSRFAAFDPFRRNEADILAGVAAAPVGLLAVDNKKKKK